MTKFAKPTASFLVITLFLFIAWATSMEKDYLVAPEISATVVNTSDSCDLASFRFVYKVARGATLDTFEINSPLLLSPGDTILFLLDSLNFQQMSYLCSCPDGLAFFRSVPIEADASGFALELIEAGCN